MAVVSGGVAAASGDMADELSGMSIRDRFARVTQIFDFEGGLGAFLGGAVSNSGAYGNALRMGGTGGLQGTQATFDLEPGMDYAVMSFDMHAIDSWDGENFMIFVDNAHVATANFQFGVDGTTGTWVTDNPDISFSVEATSGRSNVAYSDEWDDQSFRMQVTVANPGDDITLGFGSTLDQETDDESWAVDNLQVVSTNAP